ncbi:hypothetical protein C1646_770249 [Rhizophagus diaphanus]|nr:hypothetical protein C1646_770249 [Rhizophagus diaphanus] [Rhizophagus sp. MUCL 43196]
MNGITDFIVLKILIHGALIVQDIRLLFKDVKQITINKGGHEWPAKLHRIKNLNTWCPKCTDNKQLTLEEIN